MLYICHTKRVFISVTQKRLYICHPQRGFIPVILKGHSICQSKRCFIYVIQRGALYPSSKEGLYTRHPKRGFIPVIQRGALYLASKEGLYICHPKRIFLSRMTATMPSVDDPFRVMGINPLSLWQICNITFDWNLSKLLFQMSVASEIVWC